MINNIKNSFLTKSRYFLAAVAIAASHVVMAIALLACLAPMSYGYYTLVRFVAMLVFAIMAYQYLENENVPWAITFGALALLFQPFFKIALGRTLWNVVDVIVAIGLVSLWYIKTRKDYEEK